MDPISRAVLAGAAAEAILAASAAEAMLGFAAEAAPAEACGLLFGDRAGPRIAEVTLARNVAPAPEIRFEIDPQALFAAMRRDRAGPDRLVGVWHSHPDGSPEPSRHDAAGITERDWLWLIAAGGRITAWLPDGPGFRAVPLAILSGAAA
jgi:proteasome lid subunit RPN8/RPN11